MPRRSLPLGIEVLPLYGPSEDVATWHPGPLQTVAIAWWFDDPADTVLVPVERILSGLSAERFAPCAVRVDSTVEAKQLDTNGGDPVRAFLMTRADWSVVRTDVSSSTPGPPESP